jgi:hypothetical protein
MPVREYDAAYPATELAAMLYGRHGGEAVLVVDLQKLDVRTLTIDACSPLRPRLAPDGRLVIPCLNGPVLVINAADGREIERIEVGGEGASAIAVTGESTMGQVPWLDGWWDRLDAWVECVRAGRS